MVSSAATTNYGGSFETYTYSADGRRQRKVNVSGVTNFLWEQDHIVVETNAASVSFGRYTYGPGEWGNLISVNRGFPQYYVPDPQGNTRDLVYVYSGTPEDDHYIFMAFGNELGPVGPSNNPYRYNGQWGYYRDVLDRAYVQARHMDAVTGRWLSLDPLPYDGGPRDLYLYVRNSPLASTDPSGRFPVDSGPARSLTPAVEQPLSRIEAVAASTASGPVNPPPPYPPNSPGKYCCKDGAPYDVAGPWQQYPVQQTSWRTIGKIDFTFDAEIAARVNAVFHLGFKAGIKLHFTLKERECIYKQYQDVDHYVCKKNNWCYTGTTHCVMTGDGELFSPTWWHLVAGTPPNCGPIWLGGAQCTTRRAPKPC